jgi:hypothetical protein
VYLDGARARARRRSGREEEAPWFAEDNDEKKDEKNHD